MRKILFLIVGNGAGKEKLETLAAEQQLTNVSFLPLQPYELLPTLLKLADCHLVVQKRGVADAVLPSKLTNILAVGGNADKNAMLASVDNIPEITKHVDVTLVTEHVVDALCIGYVGILELRERPLYLLSV